MADSIKRICDICSNPVGIDGFANTKNGYCKSHLSSRRICSKKAGTAPKKIPFGQPLHSEIGNRTPNTPRYLDDFDWDGRL